MSSNETLLSCKFGPDGKPFSDDDIKWVEQILELKGGFDEHQVAVLQNIDCLDVEACPGSGKTTVLVAKLALLARYWKPKNQGVCVLSMTNAAREEIQERLGSTVEGQKLLHHPHFIGTIHNFFSDFLAKPYLNSKNMSILSIDDDFCRSQRLKTLQKEKYLPLTDYFVSEQVKKRMETVNTSKETTKTYADAQAWLSQHNEKSLQEKRLGIPIHWRMVDTEYNVVTEQSKPLDVPQDLLPLLKSAVKEVVQKGIFGFSDIFVYSKALLKSSPSVYKIIRTRFPFLLIDEAQDTSSSQAEFIYDLFMSEKNISECKVTRQRFGDANQTIYTFEPPMSDDGIDPYPSPKITKRTLPVSHRFDQSIAKIASIFETKPLDIPMQGMRKIDGEIIRHCILVFNEDTRKHVIPAFAELVKKQLSTNTFESAKIRVCSHIQKDKEEMATNENYARTISDYYSHFIADKLTKEYQQHSHLIDYLRHGSFLVKETKSVRSGLEKIAEGLFKSCMLVSEQYSESNSGTLFSKIRSVVNKHRAISQYISSNVSLSYTQMALRLLLSSSSVTEDDWRSFLAIINRVLCELLSKASVEFGESSFFKWFEEDIEETCQEGGYSTITERSNVYRHHFKESSEFIDIKLGTIHSVKGQTHTATLMLESSYGGPILGQLKNFLLGKEEAKNSAGNKKNWLNSLYVGLTRPTHLVCLAVPESHRKDARANTPITWLEPDFDVLKSLGWTIVRVKSDFELETV